MLEHIAGNELFARLTFFDLQTAGPVALDRADLVNDSFTAFLRPGFSPASARASLCRRRWCTPSAAESGR